MQADILKQRIYNDNKVRVILEALGCHNISENSNYISAAFPDGDNPKGILIYLDNENLALCHTSRTVVDAYGNSDIISLVCYIKNMYFSHAIQFMCTACGYDYYDTEYDQPAFLKKLNEIWGVNKHTSDVDDEDEPLQRIDEKILSYFRSCSNQMFYDDGISDSVQYLFELGYDYKTNRITIPIRDENGILVGVKGRAYNHQDEPVKNKYMYIFPCNKSKVLFGLDKSYKYIKEFGVVYVAESEKAVMQAWSRGIRNVVAIGGHVLSKSQVRMLTHLGVDICLCYDDLADYETITNSDGEKELVRIPDFYEKEAEKFLTTVEIYAIIDRNREILGLKESPFDNLDKWDKLLEKKTLIGSDW